MILAHCSGTSYCLIQKTWKLLVFLDPSVCPCSHDFVLPLYPLIFWQTDLSGPAEEVSVCAELVRGVNMAVNSKGNTMQASLFCFPVFILETIGIVSELN